MDRNTVIGFILIGALMIGMFLMNARDNQALTLKKKHDADSMALLAPKIDSVTARLDQKKADSIKNAPTATVLQQIQVKDTAEQLPVLENEVLKVTFTNKGAQPKTVELKKFKTYDGKPLILEKGSFNKFSYDINLNGHGVHTMDIPFSAGTPVLNADKSQTLSFVVKVDSGGMESITHTYTLPANDYMLDFAINMAGSDKLVTQNTINFLWETEAPQVEKVLSYERQNTNIGYVKNGDFDFDRLGKGDDKKFEKPVDWLCLKQQFFISALIAKTKFQSAEMSWITPADSTKIVAQAVANCHMQLPTGVTQASVPLQMYYGPSDYNILRRYGNQMQNIVPYGSGPFAFVKYINRHFLLPIWNFIKDNVASYGIVILLLTLLIRLITSPILYKSYLSGAKMKALKPEIDALKAKHGDDKQAFSMDQMKLWRSAGVSPLGGCLPALLQIPIFMSLYYFFQANISLRGQQFLWAKDLASYDSIATLPFSIPFYGDHVSLFTITATLTSLLISIYSMSNMQDNSNPVMKYMPYIFPILLLGVFNNLPAALTWYYTISNSITLILQIVIQKYVINHDKIRAQIDANRKKPVKQSKLAERMQAMQETNKKLQEAKAKSGRK